MLAKGQDLLELQFGPLLRDPVKAEEIVVSFCNVMLETLVCSLSSVNLQESVRMPGELPKPILSWWFHSVSLFPGASPETCLWEGLPHKDI